MVASTEASELLDKSWMKQVENNEFPDFADHGDLLDFIDFDDLFGVAGDILPDLEILSGDHMNASDKTDHSQGETNKGLSLKGEEVVSKRDDAVAETDGATDRKIKYSSSKNKEAKRKVKVDWTAELHRRFVEAVEELGVEKAVPSRILELMGVRCLTRHNIASHLQKYRSHRKHSLAREAEAANWTRKRHVYRVDTGGRNKNGWLAPTHTLGFPPRPTVSVVGPPLVHHHNFRPLHVWGHPTIDQSVVWPKHLPPPSASMTNPPFWVSQSPYWHPRFRAPLVAGIPQAMPPHHTVYKPNHGFDGAPLPMDFHPSKESVDAAIGEVLTRPWLPLPLGLKPPDVNGVVMELHRHGISDVLPTESCALKAP